MYFLKIKIYINKFWVKLVSIVKFKIKDKINVDFKFLISFNKYVKKKKKDIKFV